MYLIAERGEAGEGRCAGIFLNYISNNISGGKRTPGNFFCTPEARIAKPPLREYNFEKYRRQIII